MGAQARRPFKERFAEALGTVEGVRVTRGAVGNWELGGGISRANLAAIADKFGARLDWLKFGRGPARDSGNGGDDVDAVRKLISERLAELDSTMKEASAKIGRNESYVHQFLKRGFPAELGERDRENLGRLLGISLDHLRGPNNPLPSRLSGADAQPPLTLPSDSRSGETGIEELRERCRLYERALRLIIAKAPGSPAAEIAKSSLELGAFDPSDR
jgi:hypothetical protein